MGKVALKHAKLIVQNGKKIALVRELAIQLGLDADLVADIQKHYLYKVEELNFVKREGGL